ncbi:MAG: hypothetical protein JWP91_3423 [Fibrobacteres bacterium]|nr:hypothetical protein [Fibrobacterota bacterium]
MNRPASLRTNASLNLLISVINIAYPVLTLSYVSRIVGPDSLGMYYMALSTATYFLLLSGMGIPLYGAREAARVRNEPAALSRVFGELFLLNGAASVFCFLIFMGLVSAVPAMHRHFGLYSISGMVILANVFATDHLFAGMEDFRSIAIRNFCARLAGLVLLFLFVRGPEDLWRFAGISVLVVLASNLSGFVSAAARVGLAFRGIRPGHHLRPLATFLAILIVTATYTNLDSVTLGYLSDERQVGLYNAGLKISKIMVALVTSAGVVLFPRLTHYLKEGKREEFAALSKKSLDLICLLGCPLAVLLWMGGGEMIAIAFGSRFAEASTVLRITIPLILVIGFTNCIGMQVLFASGREKILLVSMAAAALVDISLNFLLIPGLGAAGAAIATLAAETTVLAVQVALAWKPYSLHALFDRRTASYFAASGAVCIPFLSRFPGSEVPFFRLMALAIPGCALYAGCLFALGDPLVREILAMARLRSAPKG